MIKLENISFKKDNKNILNNINLEIDTGKVIVITGPNGSGKSTIAKIIMGIENASEGTIFLNDKDITCMSLEKRSKYISYSFQQPVTFKGLTVFDIINTASHDKGKVCEYLSQVGLCANDYVNREIDKSLSGGELKRIEIASVIAHSTDIMIFDEPEAGIDLWSFNNLIEVFQNLKEKKKTLIIISHQERLFNIADQVVLLEKGKIVKIIDNKNKTNVDLTCQCLRRGNGCE